MSTNKKIGIVILVAIIGVVGFFGFQMLNPKEVEELQQVELETIQIVDNTVVLNGEVKTSETKSFTYDFGTYGEYWSTPVATGSYVEKGDIIVESSKKDYKAPFDGYITEMNVDSSYTQAKRAYDNDEMVEQPIILFTIASSDLYIYSTMTEYEISRLPQDRKVTYQIRANNEDAQHDGSVREISGTPLPKEPNSDISSYAVTINMGEGAAQARIGNHITIRISDNAQPPLKINNTSIIKEGGKSFVYIAQDGPLPGQGTITRRDVELGDVDGEQVIVKSGLNDGEKIVSTNVEALTDNQSVLFATDAATETTENAV